MSPLQVQFVMAAYSELSLMSLMSQGLHALPVLQVNAHVRALGGYVGHPFIHGTPVGQQPSAGHRHATLPFLAATHTWCLRQLTHPAGSLATSA